MGLLNFHKIENFKLADPAVEGDPGIWHRSFWLSAVTLNEHKSLACNLPSNRMGDHTLGCRTTSDRIARHNMLRDVLFEAASSADLGPSKEERHLLPGTSARPGDVTIQCWTNGKDSVIDVTVTGPLCPSNVAGAAARAGDALEKAVKRKLRETAEDC